MEVTEQTCGNSLFILLSVLCEQIFKENPL